jgi:hypothetical protein
VRGGTLGLVELGEDLGGESFAATDAAEADVLTQHGRAFDA